MAQLRLVCATCGEEGDIRQPGFATRATLGQVRHEELPRIFGQEYLMQAHPAVPPGEPLATDFLDGLLVGERA